MVNQDTFRGFDLTEAKFIYDIGCAEKICGTYQRIGMLVDKPWLKLPRIISFC